VTALPNFLRLSRLRGKFGLSAEKKHELFCLFGASRKAPKQLPNGKKTAQQTK
jgi:hypothetical protein